MIARPKYGQFPWPSVRSGWARYSSRFSFRRPQCVSLRSGLNGRSMWRFNALDHADARKHRWPVMFSDQQLRLHRSLPFSLGQFTEVDCGITQRDQLTSGRQRERTEKLLMPRHDYPCTDSPDNLGNVGRIRTISALKRFWFPMPGKGTANRGAVEFAATAAASTMSLILRRRVTIASG